MMSNARLPFFVYGTLRHGEGNYSGLLQGYTSHEVLATMPGLDMHGRSGFPYAVTNADNTQGIVGELMYVPDEIYPQVQASLDRLEGYDPRETRGWQHYLRIVRKAYLADGTEVEAYVYVASASVAKDVRESIPLIPSGDWFDAVRPRNPLTASA